jgi:hypothetical protein
LTPLISDQTLKLEHVEIHSPSSSTMGFSALKTSDYYLKLWITVLKRKKSIFKITKDANKACLHHKLAPAICWFPIDDPEKVKCWYIYFRLCNDDPLLFLQFERERLFQAIDLVYDTPDPQIDLDPKYTRKEV